MVHPLHLEIGLCWYQNKNGSKGAYALKDHIMMNLDIINALDSMSVQP